MRFVHPVIYALLAFLFLGAGCARPPAPAGYPPARSEVEQLKERAGFWRDYQAKFRLRVESRTAKFSARAVILVKGRDFARFETFVPTGQTAALFLSNETGPSLFIPSEKVIFTARKPETLIRYFLDVSLPFEVFRCTLAASVPADQMESLRTRSEGGLLHAQTRSGPFSFDWRFLPDNSALQDIHIRGEGMEVEVSYDPPVPVATGSVPQKIRITSPDWSMEISLTEIRPAREFTPSVFYLPNLPEVRKVDLDTIP